MVKNTLLHTAFSTIMPVRVADKIKLLIKKKDIMVVISKLTSGKVLLKTYFINIINLHRDMFKSSHKFVVSETEQVKHFKNYRSLNI